MPEHGTNVHIELKILIHTIIKPLRLIRLHQRLHAKCRCVKLNLVYVILAVRWKQSFIITPHKLRKHHRVVENLAWSKCNSAHFPGGQVDSLVFALWHIQGTKKRLYDSPAFWNVPVNK